MLKNFNLKNIRKLGFSRYIYEINYELKITNYELFYELYKLYKLKSTNKQIND